MPPLTHLNTETTSRDQERDYAPDDRQVEAIDKMCMVIAALKNMRFTYTPRPELSGLPRLGDLRRGAQVLVLTTLEVCNLPVS